MKLDKANVMAATATKAILAAQSAWLVAQENRALFFNISSQNIHSFILGFGKPSANISKMPNQIWKFVF